MTAAKSRRIQDTPKGQALEFVHSGEKQRLDLFLCEHLPGRSRAFVQKLIEEGWIDLSGFPLSREVKAATMILDGVRVKVTLPPSRKSSIEAENIPLQILYEDDDLAVVNKPAGLVMHPSPNQVHGTLVNALLYRLKDLSGIGGEERPGIVHRLDRFTSGALVVAKNDLAHQLLSSKFKERHVEKKYVAILRGQWTAEEGSINLPIGRSYLNRKRMMVRTDGRGRESITNYRILEGFDGYSYAEIRPITGRTHQIRVHMAKIRLPVACDGLYGREQWVFLSDLQRRVRLATEEPLISRQALHASTIRFDHPTSGEPLAFEAPLPEDMQLFLDALRKYSKPR